MWPRSPAFLSFFLEKKQNIFKKFSLVLIFTICSKQLTKSINF